MCIFRLIQYSGPQGTKKKSSPISTGELKLQKFGNFTTKCGKFLDFFCGKMFIFLWNLGFQMAIFQDARFD